MIHVDAAAKRHAPVPGSGSPGLVGWLEAVLHERVSPALRLVDDGPSGWTVQAAGSPRRLAFVHRELAFYTPGSDPPAGFWNPCAEGFDPALEGALPAPGLEASDAPLFEWSAAGARARFDLPGLLHWALARLEEIGRPELDLYGRFDVRASHAWRHGYLHRPFVDEWFCILSQAVDRLWPGLPRPESTFEVLPTHDVDEPSRYAFRSPSAYLRALAGDVLRRGAWLDALRSPAVRRGSRRSLHRWDPYNTFDWIMAQSERYGLRSAFYFICGRTDPARDADYDPRHPAIRSLMRDIHRRGHEIGLHPSFGSPEAPGQIALEARTLRAIADSEGIDQERWGGRMHYLRWTSPDTARAWAEAGLDYDSTLGYGAAPGFRCGTCHEYPAFDSVQGRALDLRLRPLVAMDATVTAARYMNLGLGSKALDRFLAVRRACEAVRGPFTFLWHNSELQHPKARWLYKSVLAGRAVDEAAGEVAR